MNAIFANQTTTATSARTERPRRRRRVGQYLLAPAALEDFNRVLGRLQAAPIDQDQIASIGRRLCPRPAATVAPAWVAERMREAASVRMMVADPDWEPMNGAAEPARLVAAYLCDHDGLIPDHLPALGRLDDAIVVAAAWPRLAAEVRDYLDYRRIRRIEAELRGCAESQFHFHRADWEQARRAETALARHMRAVGCRSYLPAPGPRGFRIC